MQRAPPVKGDPWTGSSWLLNSDPKSLDQDSPSVVLAGTRVGRYGHSSLSLRSFSDVPVFTILMGCMSAVPILCGFVMKIVYLLSSVPIVISQGEVIFPVGSCLTPPFYLCNF